LSAPIIWILVPGVIAFILLIFHRWILISLLITTILAAILAVLILMIPIGEEIQLGSLVFIISDSLGFLGRQVVIQQNNSPMIALIFAGVAVWNGCVYIARASSLFPPISLAAAALLVGALTVQPFLYAALVLEIIALLMVPLLITYGRPVGKGVLRLVTNQTLGMPFVLFVGWMLTDIGSGFATTEMYTQAIVLLSFGFLLLLGFFPVHSWVPMLMKESHPYQAAYVIYFITLAALFFGYELISRYEWIISLENLVPILSAVGAFGIAINGILVMFERHLGRILGYMLLIEIGFSVVAVGLAVQSSSPLFWGLLIPRLIAFALWSLGLALLWREDKELTLNSVSGLSKRNPWIATSLIVGQFCVLGFPLLAMFPIKMALLQQIGQIVDIGTILLIAVGVGGSVIISLRILSAVVSGPLSSAEIDQSQLVLKLPILLSIVLLVLLGLVPGLMFRFILWALL
jgi:NADH-quinone oxidoreductase subunit N